MRCSASTQQLLDELAARERRVLQQLRDLSGMKASPIAPSRPCASLPMTPERLNVASTHPASSTPLPQLLPSPLSTTEHEEYQVKTPSWRQQGSCHHDVHHPSRGTLGNLERDLQRLQYLLRHSPLTGTQAAIADAGDENGSEATNAQQSQQHLPMTHRDDGAAMAREKRTREARRPNLSASPVTPEVKRDRQEMEAYYAPPPPLTPLPSYAEASLQHPGGGSTSPARGSAVLSMDDEPCDEDVALASDALAHFSQVAAGLVTSGVENRLRRANTTMFPGRCSAKTVGGLQASPYREPDDTVPREAHSRQGVTPAVTPSTSEWRRSPVRWFSSSAPTATSISKDAPRHEWCEEGEEEVTMLCVSALDAWAAHRSAHCVPHGTANFDSASIATSPPPARTFSRASRPPLSPSRPGELSDIHATPHPALPSTNSPPHVPARSPSPFAKTCQLAVSTAGLTFLTPTLDEDGAAQPFAATLPPQAATPQETLHSGNDHHSSRVSTEPQTSCVASALPSGVMRTTSWSTLKAFYARQSSAGALMTPSWEEGTR
ncbi:hypothetical protein, unknown function [Leishmania infantum JPCM5]|uniref:Uncharacterized protein n=2 Tax=Leishmania infantum TaxID=5671 RepID=A4I4F6_LEIIN|nr:hypothetical protein, unknown function [Leishmania infantum JPCM5]CAC9508015.1 hypothetical_protein_-_conserved [Leishmania infantum]CAM69665.1 hypothetical protein, unknown function [Leishmania infantum JPCM5]SUZ43605.1 hypothetical_protein_-_conserved [Leishmania infantum]|eukprot:XP_001466625.1 hypothetical protein, unknown function [Leishmania infantum JPCM5]